MNVLWARRAVTGVALLLPLFASCSGESERQQRRSPAATGGKTGAAGGKHAGAAGCVSCGAGSGGRAGSGAAGVTGGGARAGGGGIGRGGESGHAASGAGAATAGSASTGGKAGTGGQGGSAPAAGTSSESAGGMGGEAALGGSLVIRKIAAYQGVEVTLMEGGEKPPPNAPIVAERELLLRAWLEPAADWVGRSVAAELTLAHPSAPHTVSVTQLLEARSEDGDLGSTLNFTIRAEDVTEETSFALSIREATSPNAELARWPANSEESLGASSSLGPLEIVLVPLVVGGFTPDLGTQNLMRFSRYMNHLYPASEVAMSVHAPYPLDYDLDSQGDGWDEALDELYALRDADDPATNVYYYGVLTPGATFNDYCPVDCVVGLSAVASRNDESSRGSIGTGYFESASDTFSQETLGHELGHALGREHAPCGDPDYPDPDYPYDGASIGVYGYDGRSLVDPFEALDVMSYCVPVWISDYSWNALFTRINYVNGLAAKRVPAPRATRPRQRTLIVGHDGNLRWGREQAPATPPSGDPVLVELLDAAGSVLDVVAAPFAPFNHLSGGFLSVPVSALARTGADSVRVDGQIVPIR